MRCPFLREEQVKSCEAAPYRKALARSAAQVEIERCSSSDFVRCPMLQRSHEAHPNPSRCPFLRESLAQFCAARPSPTYVPWSASPELRCAHDGHRFCDLFLDVSGEDARRPSSAPVDADEGQTQTAAGVPMPGWLFYAESHLWLDRGDDGVCHVGIDAFLAQLAGAVERLEFAVTKGTACPAVVLTVRGNELALRFPNPLVLVAAHTRLRARLEPLTADPYGLGWLFQARDPDRAASPGELTAGLRHGQAAREWMAAEVRRVSQRVHERLVAGGRARMAADGGRFARGLLQRIKPGDLRQLAELVPFATRRNP